MRSLLFLSTIVMSLSLYATPKYVASIVKTRGSATVLLPGMKAAEQIKEGLKLPSDSSIVTERRSVVVVEYLDKSQVTVGPNSKIVVRVTEESAKGVVNLLTGKIRAAVIKNSKDDKDSFFVKTKTAAMGVRGTNFQTTYNEINKMTTLLTIEGKVAMKKVEAKEMIKEKEIVQALAAPILVQKGELSFANERLKNETEPVRISPKQYTIIKLNKEFHEKPKISEKEIAKEIIKTEQEFAKVDTDKEKAAKIEGKFNNTTSRFHPRSGGILDINTGIYVQPSAASAYDDKLKVFVDDNAGGVSVSGEYVPPKGLALDAQKGFVASESVKNSEKTVMVNLNNQITEQVVEPKNLEKPTLNDVEDSGKDAYDRYYNY